MCDPPTTPRVEQAEGPVVERNKVHKQRDKYILIRLTYDNAWSKHVDEQKAQTLVWSKMYKLKWIQQAFAITVTVKLSKQMPANEVHSPLFVPQQCKVKRH